MWDKQMAVGKKQVVKKSKEKQINCICKIKKVGKDLVFNLGDGSTDLITLTTNYIELKDDKLWEVKAKEWKSGGVWQGVDRLKMRNMKKKLDRKSTRLNSSHVVISYAVFCLKKKKETITI